MAMVHEHLYRSRDVGRVNIGDYARDLMTYQVRSYGAAERVRICVETEPVLLDVERATPCGLILNELATNALKHAFHGRQHGEITVELRAGADGRAHLRFADNGIGLPPGRDWRQASSLGLRLIQMLTRQLDGTVEAHTGSGTEFRLCFPIEERHAVTRQETSNI
jgi:two-component sensor histidine kinase